LLRQDPEGRRETLRSKALLASGSWHSRAIGLPTPRVGASLSDATNLLGGSICRGRLLRRDRADHHTAIERNTGPAGDCGEHRPPTYTTVGPQVPKRTPHPLEMPSGATLARDRAITRRERCARLSPAPQARPLARSW